jgi:dipeptidyl aminopeptidase/acylaminoacyl peptidase
MLLSPDVHFNTGATGDDMLECIEAAVDKAVELGYADPDRVGLCGHSFSGYGATYIATRSKKFAAVSAGAGVMDHVSDFNHLWGYSAARKKGSGSNAHQYDIYGQGRMGTNPHDNFELYRDQSPVTHVKDMTTPLLLMQGEADSTVAWIEAIEMYNAMRFNGKNIILLSYPDEGHGLSKRANKIDFTKRVIEFFDHYLMDKPAPDWITNGVPFKEKKK